MQTLNDSRKEMLDVMNRGWYNADPVDTLARLSNFSITKTRRVLYELYHDSLIFRKPRSFGSGWLWYKENEKGRR